MVAIGNLLLSDLAEAIVAGTILPLEDIVMGLLIGVTDAEAMTASDSSGTQNERRTARQVLGMAFLSALALAPEHDFHS